MWIIEEGREGFRLNGFIRVVSTQFGIQLYGDSEGVDEYGYEIYRRKASMIGFKFDEGVVNNKELIEHIKRIS